MKNITLIGPMGCGKSFIGEQLAQRLHREFVDIDQQIVENSGMSIQQIFEHQGEAAFRLLEEEELQAALEVPNRVIATGGGVVLSRHNRECIQSSCWTVYLQVSATVALRRCEQSPQVRPLLNHDNKLEKWQEIMRVRESLYAELADSSFQTDTCSAAALVEQIIQAWEQKHG